MVRDGTPSLPPRNWGVPPRVTAQPVCWRLELAEVKSGLPLHEAVRPVVGGRARACSRAWLSTPYQDRGKSNAKWLENWSSLGKQGSCVRIRRNPEGGRGLALKLRTQEMRVMELPPFRQRIEITDLENLYRTRLSLRLDLRASAAVPLLCYMGWPNDSAAREAAIRMLARWLDAGDDNDAAKHLAEIDEDWGHVADLVHLHLDIDQGPFCIGFSPVLVRS